MDRNVNNGSRGCFNAEETARSSNSTGARWYPGPVILALGGRADHDVADLDIGRLFDGESDGSRDGFSAAAISAFPCPSPCASGTTASAISSHDARRVLVGRHAPDQPGRGRVEPEIT